MGKSLEQNLAHCKCHISVRFIVGVFCSHSHYCETDRADFAMKNWGSKHTLVSCSVWNLPDSKGRQGPAVGPQESRQGKRLPGLRVVSISGRKR